MALCPRCTEPIGLVHRCKPPVASDVPPQSVEALARRALMMADAGYDVDPILLRLAAGYLEIFSTDGATPDPTKVRQSPSPKLRSTE